MFTVGKTGQEKPTSAQAVNTSPVAGVRYFGGGT